MASASDPAGGVVVLGVVQLLQPIYTPFRTAGRAPE